MMNDIYNLSIKQKIKLAKTTDNINIINFLADTYAEKNNKITMALTFNPNISDYAINKISEMSEYNIKKSLIFNSKVPDSAIIKIINQELKINYTTYCYGDVFIFPSIINNYFWVDQYIIDSLKNNNTLRSSFSKDVCDAFNKDALKKFKIYLIEQKSYAKNVLTILNEKYEKFTEEDLIEIYNSRKYNSYKKEIQNLIIKKKGFEIFE